MPGLTLTRRSLLKAAAVGGAALALQPNFASQVFAEEEETLAEGEVKRIRSFCRACGKMECPTWVTVQEGRVVDIQGDESAITSRGSLCSKGKSAVQALYHPDRVKYPVKRTQPKGEDPGWVRISWDEAIQSAADNLKLTQEKYGNESVMTLHGTSRITSYGAMLFGDAIQTPNSGTTAGQVCKGPRITSAGLMAYPGAHWILLADGVKCFFQWGSNTEISNYDNAARVTVDAQVNAEKSICIGPRLQNLGKEADIWVPVRPGTDDFVAAGILNIIVNEMKTYDDLFVKKWTNAPFLFVEDLEPTGFLYEMNFPGGLYPMELKTRLLKESDILEGGSPRRFMIWDTVSQGMVFYDTETALWEGETEFTLPIQTSRVGKYGVFAEDPGFVTGIDPALDGEYEITLKDGRTVKAVPVWQKFSELLSTYTPEYVAEVAWTDPQNIRDVAETYGGELYQGGIQYNLAIEHAGNASQTAKLILLISTIMGNLDGVGGNCGGAEAFDNINMTWISYCAPVGANPKMTPQDQEKVAGFDKFPLIPYFRCFTGASMFYDLTSAIDQILTGDPYPIRACLSATGSHFHAANATKNWEAFKALDYYWAAELWFTPTVELADVVVPAKHFLEQSAFRLSQGADRGLGAQVQCVEPLGEARWDSAAIVQICKGMGRDWWPRAETAPSFWPQEWLDTQWPDEKQMLELTVLPMRLGITNPGPDGDTISATSFDDFVAQYQEHGQWDTRQISPLGYYRRYLWGYLREDHKLGFPTPTGKVEIYSLLLESRVPGEELPVVREPTESPYSTPEDFEEYPVVITTGRRIPVYFHNEHRQLPFTREQAPVPTFQIHPMTAEKYGIAHGDWCWVESKRGRVRLVADFFQGIAPDVIECEHAWWFPELPAPNHGWDISNINVLVDEYNQDPITGSTCLRAFLCKIYKAEEGAPEGVIDSPEHPKLKEWLPVYEEVE